MRLEHRPRTFTFPASSIPKNLSDVDALYLELRAKVVRGEVRIADAKNILIGYYADVLVRRCSNDQRHLGFVRQDVCNLP